ncbi:MAG: MFS transporter [Candidatus Omnitrophota bacterium]|jgi:MFS family permease|nr:MAG: MFS transporter [Candidatus Omnitrophota bacterium]
MACGLNLNLSLNLDFNLSLTIRMSHFFGVLKNRNFFFLWVGQIISQLGDRLGQMALIGFVYLKAPGSTLEIAKVLSFTILPVFLIGPIAGVYVDRWDRRKTMFICDLLRSLLVLTIPLFLFYKQNFGWVYLIIFLTFSVGRFFVPAKLSIIPEVVRKEELLVANSLVNITGMIAAVLGFGVSGLVVEWLGARSGFFLDSFGFLISGTFIFLIANKPRASMNITKVGREIVEVIRKSVFEEIKEGVVYFITQKEIRFTAWIIFILWSALGAVYVVMIVFVQNTLHSATKDLGLLIMFLGAGLLFGSVIYGHLGHRLSQYKTIFASLIVSGIMLVIFAEIIYRYPNFLIAASLAFILGLLISPIIIASNTIIHNASANHMMGKIFSSLEIVMHLGFLIFMFISSSLAEHFSNQAILITVGYIVIIVGLVGFALNRKLAWLD